MEEWEERVTISFPVKEWNNWQQRIDRSSGVTFFHSNNESLLVRDQWTPPPGWPHSVDEEEIDDETDGAPSEESLSTARSTSSDDMDTARSNKVTEEIKDIMTTLTSNEEFLCTLREKLGLDPNDINTPKLFHKFGGSVDDSSASDDSSDSEDDRIDEIDRLQHSAKAIRLQRNVPALGLDAVKNGASSYNPGEGWKRLKYSIIPKDFATRAYKTTTEGPQDSLNAPNDPEVAGMIDPAESENYQQPTHIPDLKVLFVAVRYVVVNKNKNIVLIFV